MTHRLAVAFAVSIVSCSLAAAEPPMVERRADLVTVQSELDYLAAAKTVLSIELTQVTARQAFEEVAQQAAIRIAFEVPLTGEHRYTLIFKEQTLKHVLTTLADAVGVTYRVDRPDTLTIVSHAP